MTDQTEHHFDRKDRIDANRFVDAMKKRIASLTVERDALIARYEPHNVPKPAKAAKAKKARVIAQAPFAAHAYALRKYAEAVEDIGAGWESEVSDVAVRFGSYWAMFVTVDEDARRLEPLMEAEAEQAYGHYERMVAHHIAGGRLGS